MPYLSRVRALRLCGTSTISRGAIGTFTETCSGACGAAISGRPRSVHFSTRELPPLCANVPLSYPDDRPTMRRNQERCFYISIFKIFVKFFSQEKTPAYCRCLKDRWNSTWIISQPYIFRPSYLRYSSRWRARGLDYAAAPEIRNAVEAELYGFALGSL